MIQVSDYLADRSNRTNCWFWSSRFFLAVQYSSSRFSWVSSFSRITDTLVSGPRKVELLTWCEKYCRLRLEYLRNVSAVLRASVHAFRNAYKSAK